MIDREMARISVLRLLPNTCSSYLHSGYPGIFCTVCPGVRFERKAGRDQDGWSRRETLSANPSIYGVIGIRQKVDTAWRKRDRAAAVCWHVHTGCTLLYYINVIATAVLKELPQISNALRFVPSTDEMGWNSWFTTTTTITFCFVFFLGSQPVVGYGPV